LESVTLKNVELDLPIIGYLTGLSIDLSITNATFRNHSFDYLKAPFFNNLRSVRYTGFLIVSAERRGVQRGDGHVWVVGDKMQAVAAMAEYDKYVGDPVLVGQVPHVDAEGVEVHGSGRALITYF
jgi:hypothetical protein